MKSLRPDTPPVDSVTWFSSLHLAFSLRISGLCFQRFSQWMSFQSILFSLHNFSAIFYLNFRHVKSWHTSLQFDILKEIRPLIPLKLPWDWITMKVQKKGPKYFNVNRMRRSLLLGTIRAAIIQMSCFERYISFGIYLPRDKTSGVYFNPDLFNFSVVMN